MLLETASLAYIYAISHVLLMTRKGCSCHCCCLHCFWASALRLALCQADIGQVMSNYGL